MRKTTKCLDAMRMMWLVSILAFAAMMSGCATHTHEDDTINDYTAEIFGSDDLSRKNGDDDFDSTKPDTMPLPTLPSLPYFETSPTIIAEEFLNQFVSVFFGLISDEPAISANEQDVFDNDGRWVGWYVYFTDGYGEVAYDVPFIKSLYGVRYDGGNLFVYAERFSIFTLDDGVEPLVIAIRYETARFSGGVYFLYEIINNGGEFLQIGSMIAYSWGGPGPEAINLIPFINESGDIIVSIKQVETVDFHKINSEGDFEFVAYAQLAKRDAYGNLILVLWVEDEKGERHAQLRSMEELERILANQGQAQNLFPNFPDGNFMPMTRMYDLEQELTERITERLRGTFPVVERSEERSPPSVHHHD